MTLNGCNVFYKFLRLIILLVCLCVSSYQLRNPPTSTHYDFFLNESLRYPVVTICRNPPFKTELFKKYGLLNSEITYATTWNTFNYNNYTLQEFFDEVTYNFHEIVSIAALDKYQKNMNIASFFTLTYGRCFAISPKNESTHWGNKYGYYFYLAPVKTNTSLPSGFHVFIHEEQEIFTEKEGEGDVFQEYLYVEAGDSVQVNLKINKYNQMPSRNNACNDLFNYSKSRCVEDNVNKIISEYVGCKTPWIPNENLHSCNNYEQLRLMVTNSTSSAYLQNSLQKSSCIRKCKTTMYLPFLQSIREIEASAWSLKIYFSTNLITQMEEVIGYDWNNLISDLGGSLGFLLGLSVFGSIGLIEHFVRTLQNKSSKKINGQDANDDSKNNAAAIENIVLQDAANIIQDETIKSFK